MPIFSLIYFVLSWAYVIFFLLSLMYNCVRKQEKGYSLSDYDKAQDDEEELRSILTSEAHDD